MLASSDPELRRNAAIELYRAGRQLGDSALNLWLRADAELAEIFCEYVLVPAELTLKPRMRKSVVGIAVLPETFERIRAANGSPRLADVPPDQDAKEFELEFEGAALDVLTAREPGGAGAIAKFLQKFGEGIQQVEYYVRDVSRATRIIRERFGVKPIYAQTRAGADATRVNFFLVGTPEGKKVLIELVEDARV
jgi:hypothetical protein